MYLGQNAGDMHCKMMAQLTVEFIRFSSYLRIAPSAV